MDEVIARSNLENVKVLTLFQNFKKWSDERVLFCENAELWLSWFLYDATNKKYAKSIFSLERFN